MVIQIMEKNVEGSSRGFDRDLASELTPVQLDHSYAKPWNWRQEMAHCKPVRTLFSEEPLSNADDIINVDEPAPQKFLPIINRESTDINFTDAEHKINMLEVDEIPGDWEDTVRREGWTPLQHRVFNKVVKLLVADNMARLATEKMENEAIQKKIHVEGASKKLRIILSSVAWDVKIIQWLHLTLMEHLSRDYLMGYINILQVLRNKVPALVDRILNIPLINTKLMALNNQIINYVANKPWEPALNSVAPTVAKLPVVPFIIMVPSGTSNYNTSTSLGGSRRFQTWHNLLQTLGRVMTVSLNTVPSPHSLPLPVLVESLINATVQRIQDLKAGCPGRPIILVGLQQGALIAAQVAQLEPVTALVYLGFPLFSVDGKRGEPDDFILDLRSPAMFVVGKSSTTCNVDGMEQLRHRMKAESTLLVVDGAVDSLRMLKWKKKQQNVTQAAVDASILEEISVFITSVLNQTQGAPDKKSPISERKPSSDGLPSSAPAGSVKRPRYSNDGDDSGHPALSGHNYSQSTPFVQPWKGRGGTGLARVRGGRVGPSHSRTPYQRTLSESLSPTSKARLGRSVSAHRLMSASGEHLPPGRPSLHRGLTTVRSCPSQLDGEADSKSSVSSSQGSPKEEGAHPPMECKGGGDSSETESAPPADDDDEIMEDLRFCNEFMSKQQQHHNPSTSKQADDSATEDDFNLKLSGDEADFPLAEVCKRLNAENRNRKNASSGAPE